MLILRTFGGLSMVRADGQLLRGAAAQRGRLAILAVLAVAGERGISRDRLLSLFWPDSDEDRARGALKQALYALRREVGEVTLGGSELRLDPSLITSDVTGFEVALAEGRLEDAVHLYAGPFLDGIHLRRVPEFEQWVDRERQRLEHAQRGALERLARSAEAAGEAVAAVRWWRTLAAADPLSGRAALALVNALAAAGDREAAIRHFEIHTARVRSDLEMDADPELVARIRDLRGPGDPQTALAGGDGDGPAAVADARARDAVRPTAAAVPSTIASRPAPARASRHRLAILGAGAFGVAALLLALAQRPPEPADRVLVLPLTNETGDTSLASVGRMTADWIMEGLSAMRGAELVDYRVFVSDSAANLDETRAIRLAHAAGAGRLLRGTAYRVGDSLALQLQLVRVADGEVVGRPVRVMGRADDPRGAVEAARQRVMGLFAAGADRRFPPLSRGASQPPRYDAYQAFVRGLASLAADEFDNPDWFLKAAALDTTFLQAKVYALLNAPPEVADSMLAAAERQRPTLGPYDLASLDFITGYARQDWEAAWRGSRRMVESAPWSADARLFHAQSSITTGRFAEAVATLEMPGDEDVWLSSAGPFWDWAARAYHYTGDFAGEARVFERARLAGWVRAGACFQLRPWAARGHQAAVDSIIAACMQNPRAPVEGALWMGAANEYEAHGHQAAAARARVRARAWYTEQNPPWEEAVALLDFGDGRWRDVRRFWEAADRARPLGPRRIALIGIAAAQMGDTAVANDILRRIEGMTTAPPEQRAVSRALVFAALGRRADAVVSMRDARSMGFALFRLHSDEAVARLLRGYPDWEALTASRDGMPGGARAGL